ncbi:MAG TPA: helicase-related protein [Gemmatimonadales bacterium]|nr:helicase-related protein [Gemmatimonadales bacterium]
MTLHPVRDHYLPPDPEAFRRAEPATGRVIVIAPTRAACETIELAMHLRLETVLEREHGNEVRALARGGKGFGIVAGTGTGKTLGIRPIAEEILGRSLRVGVVNREREATPETPTWNVVIVTTGIARRWFQADLIGPRDALVVDEIHQTSAELELCLALGKRVGCRFIWLSATVDPAFYARYLESSTVLETVAFDPALAARVMTRRLRPPEFLDDPFLRNVVKGKRGVAVFLPTRAEVEQLASDLGDRWRRLNAAFYHGGEPIRVIRPFLDGTAPKPFLLAMTAAGQSALNISGLDTVVIYDAKYSNVVARGRNILTRQYLGANELLQMAGRVHGRVAGGEVYILTDRALDFRALAPEPPELQLAGDTERVAMTAAAIGVDLRDLDLPVPLDREAYARAVRLLETRGLVANGHLTDYGRDVEAMPVERPWGELLAHADTSLVPVVAVAANIESLHRMTREERDLSGLIEHGSDHLTAYNVFAEAVREYGYLGEVYGLSRHLFADELEEWASRRGVLVKAVEDVALGLASVFRTLERPLPERLQRCTRAVAREFRELVAQVAPFELALDGMLAGGDAVRVSKSSVCSSWGAIAGSVRYFADRFGVPRAAIEGTNLPLDLLRRHAQAMEPTVHVRDGRKAGLVEERRMVYAGFELSREQMALVGPFSTDLASKARDALAQAVLDRRTPHVNQSALARAAERLNEYWRRSGGTLAMAAPPAVFERVRAQLDGICSWEDFLGTRLSVDVDVVPEDQRRHLDRLPASVQLLGDRVPLHYDVANGEAVVRLRLREGQARRLRPADLPTVDRALWLEVARGRSEMVRARSVEELVTALRALPRTRRRSRR